MPHLYDLSPSNLSKLPTTLFLPHYTLTTLVSSVLQGCYPLSYIKDFANAVPASWNVSVWPAASQPLGLTLEVWPCQII